MSIEAPTNMGVVVLSSDSHVPPVEQTISHADAAKSNQENGVEVVDPEPLSEYDKGEYPDPGDAFSLETERQEAERKYLAEAADTALQEHLRLSSYHWRRTIYPPMKGSGHVTLDCCTPRGTFLMSDKT
jgi:hypothetical protein